MGSKTFDGVWFVSFSRDHLPPHVHGYYAETTVIVELRDDGTTCPADRRDWVQPDDAKRSDIRHILSVAAEHGTELRQLWEKAHGTI